MATAVLFLCRAANQPHKSAISRVTGPESMGMMSLKIWESRRRTPPFRRRWAAPSVGARQRRGRVSGQRSRLGYLASLNRLLEGPAPISNAKVEETCAITADSDAPTDSTKTLGALRPTTAHVRVRLSCSCDDPAGSATNHVEHGKLKYHRNAAQYNFRGLLLRPAKPGGIWRKCNAGYGPS